MMGKIGLLGVGAPQGGMYSLHYSHNRSNYQSRSRILSLPHIFIFSITTISAFDGLESKAKKNSSTPPQKNIVQRAGRPLSTSRDQKRRRVLLTFFPTHMYVHMYTLTFGTCSEFSSMV
jgi:hypothetical protein